MSLFTELKRRNVIRVGIAYLIIGWLLAQVSTTLEDALNLPPWFDTFIVTVMLIGFPIVLIIAWVYELTPEGIKKEKDIKPNASITQDTSRKLNYITVVAAIAVAGMFTWQQFGDKELDTRFRENDGVVAVNEGIRTVNNVGIIEGKSESIAVLPFVNMSSDKEQDYFADGISEEILNVLVKIPKLKVAGRTSSFSFKGKNQDLRKIGDALGVNHILEGSVRRSNTKLRITAQLIRSDDGFHLWSDTYDREIADIFDIQDEIAKEVAKQLAISLGLQIKTTGHNRTDDLVAYENYLKAKQLYLLRGRDNLDAALKLLNDATTRDPNFAPAWTTIALIYGVYSSYVNKEEELANHEQWNATGIQAAQHALTLDPESGEAHAALGTFFSYKFEFIKAYQQFDLALKLSPDNPVILDKVAQSSWEVGYLKQALHLSQKTVEIDPLVAMYRNVLGASYVFSGKKDDAIINYEKSIELDPTLQFPYSSLRRLYTNPDDIEKIIPLIKRAIKNKVYPKDSLDKAYGFVELISDKTLLKDKKTLQKMILETTNLGLKFFLITQLQDGESFIDLIEKISWNKSYRSSTRLFFPKSKSLGIYNNKRWKQQIRKDGVLALWQSRGFPAHCKPIGDDDFQCE
jgi:TolB-like protein